MTFAVALSTHPVSSHAAGEVIGRLFETGGPHADLLVLLASPGHRGALDDIVATARRLLNPGVTLAAVTSGLGAGEDWVERGPGLAAWSGSCGPVAALGPGQPEAPFEPAGAFVLTTAAGVAGGWPAPDRDPAGGWPAPDRDPAGGSPRRDASPSGRWWPGVPVVAGAMAGPIMVAGSPDSPVAVTARAGVVFGAGSGFGAAVAHGLRGLGPGLTVTRAEGAMVYELDGQPALRRLVDVARDGMPAVDLPTLGDGLHLRQAPSGADPAPEPWPVLGADRDNGAIAVRGPVEAGVVVQFARADPGAVGATLGRAFGSPPDAVLLLTPARAGRLLAGARRTDTGLTDASLTGPGPGPGPGPGITGPGITGPGLTGPGPGRRPDAGLTGRGVGDPGPADLLPAATLIGATLPAPSPGSGRPETLVTTTAAYFSSAVRPR